MQDAGTDLESVVMGGMDGGREVGRREGCGDGIWSVWDVFWGVAIALGKGEEEARFEVSPDAVSHALKGKLTCLSLFSAPRPSSRKHMHPLCGPPGRPLTLP